MFLYSRVKSLDLMSIINGFSCLRGLPPEEKYLTSPQHVFGIGGITSTEKFKRPPVHDYQISIIYLKKADMIVCIINMNYSSKHNIFGVAS